MSVGLAIARGADDLLSEEPAFLEEDGPSAEIPTFITTTNSLELFGLRDGESVAEAMRRTTEELARASTQSEATL